jgi:hypothetical protein
MTCSSVEVERPGATDCLLALGYIGRNNSGPMLFNNDENYAKSDQTRNRKKRMRPVRKYRSP